MTFSFEIFYIMMASESYNIVYEIFHKHIYFFLDALHKKNQKFLFLVFSYHFLLLLFSDFFFNVNITRVMDIGPNID